MAPNKATAGTSTVNAVVGAATLLSCIASCLAAKEYNPAFYVDEWDGVCATGKMQTPIDLPARYDELPAVPLDLVTDIKMPLVKHPEIINKGSAIQVRPDHLHWAFNCQLQYCDVYTCTAVARAYRPRGT